MRILVLATLLSATSGVAASADRQAAAPPSASVRATPATPWRGSLCRDRLQVIPADTPAPPKAKRLGELPPGDTILAVYREREDGCIDPVIVRYGDGRPAPATPEPERVRPRAGLYR